MKRLAAILMLTIAPSTAWACSGTVLQSATGNRAVTVLKGQRLTNLDHFVRDPRNENASVCAHDTCFPAIVATQQAFTEIVRIEGCTIARDHSVDREGSNTTTWK